MDIEDIASAITDDPDIIVEALANGRHVYESFLLSESAGVVPPAETLGIMSKSGAKFVLIGGHAISGFTGRPRATKDIDVVSRDFDKIFAALSKVHDDLSVEEGDNTYHIRKGGEEFVDVIEPEGVFKSYEMVLKRSGSQKMRMGKADLKIPNLEAALASKFGAMLNTNRAMTSRLQDSVDFLAMVKHNMRAINLKKLSKLGDTIFMGGGIELVKQVESAMRDRPPTFSDDGTLNFKMLSSAGLWASSAAEDMRGR